MIRMGNVAFVPIRGGNKVLSLIKQRKLCGKPIIYWSIKAVCECKYIEKVNNEIEFLS